MRQPANRLWGIFWVIVLLAAVTACGSGNQNDGVPFSYAQILKKEYKYDVGKAVPVTIEQALEMHGYFDDNGRYFFFTSNREQGNYDIYVRELSGIHSVRLTTHPSRDTSPAMSPSGNRLAFVSYRDDPEGDIFVMEVDLPGMVKKDSTSFFNITMDRNPERNLTKWADSESNEVRLVKDASPSWSRDGKYIAYSSARGGVENIWMMRSDGSEKRQVTYEGGMYPRFSRDGKYIIFVSYRNDENGGDIYRVHTVTGEEDQLTDTKAIELYPSFMIGT
ncbi:MAG: TolB family protein, partial [Spirochaetota bacterium]